MMKQSGYAVTPAKESGLGGPGGPSVLNVAKLRHAIEVQSTMDHLKVLLAQEASLYPTCEDYFARMDSKILPDASDRVNETWRRKLCEWCYEVVDHFSFDREVVSIALNFLDRAVALKTSTSEEPISKRNFQLIAVTCLYTAIKLHGETDSIEGPRRKLRIGAFVELSRGFFQVEIIEAMELEILQALEWRVHPPTCLRFVASFLRLCPKWTVDEYDTSSSHTNVVGGIYDVARYLSELSVCVSTFSFTCKNSVVAYASIYCAMEALQKSLPLPYDVRVTFLNNLAEATHLIPEMEEVRRVREMIKNLCPSMFEGEEVPSEFLFDRTSVSVHVNNEELSSQGKGKQGNGKSSPVCVVDAEVESPSSHNGRKRSRTTGVAEETAFIQC